MRIYQIKDDINLINGVDMLIVGNIAIMLPDGCDYAAYGHSDRYRWVCNIV